ncbi:MAG: hypothetical protein M3445_04225 [Actinomycetota bacterium]|nr:hypothetical protein [Actinomycetota bacterium]
MTIAAAKGAPGVTTTALVMGALWPRQVLVAECDAAGADIPLRMSAADGGVLDPDRGLLSLAAAGRKGLHPQLVLNHTQHVIGGTEVLAGVRMPEQAAGMTNIWPLLGPALDGVPGYDVLADAGRIGATTPQSALLRSSRLLILVCTTEPSAVVHTRQRLNTLAPLLDPASPVGTPIAVIVIAEPKSRDAVDEVRETFKRTEVPLLGMWHLAYDPKGAGFFKGRLVGRADKTLLVRTAREATQEVASIVEPFFVALEQTGSSHDEGPGDWDDFTFAAPQSPPVPAPQQSGQTSAWVDQPTPPPGSSQ